MTQKNNKSTSAVSNNRNLIIGIVAAVVVATVGIIALSASGTTLGGSSVNYADIAQGRQDDGGFVLGDPDAPITVVAFEDFLCPACQQYESTVKQFIETYVMTGQARFEYRILPAVNPTYSVVAGQLAECSETLREGSFWDAHDELFRLARAGFSDRSARTFAENMGFNYAELLDCASDATQWQTDQQLATQMGVTGTPTVLVRYADGVLRPSPVGPRPDMNGFAALIDSAN